MPANTRAPEGHVRSPLISPPSNQGVIYDLISSLITPGVPSSLLYAIYAALVLALIFVGLSLYYGGFQSIFIIGFVVLIGGLFFSLSYFISLASELPPPSQEPGNAQAKARTKKNK
eukprot:TRINITY_DN4712_c0_g2_i3.p1 TRINITY_DN4712_c0_g2~~TRINITY_DN4712_c0_g2_i3.p1  ORF type:complete len:116 (+),score=15.07 TRINITY_DN4712_c0_g2_i3:59-406(+)